MPLRNPRSFRPTEDEPEERRFNREDHMIVEMARHSLRQAIAQLAGPGTNELALLVVAVAGMFADLVAASPRGGPQLIAVINAQLASAGVELVEKPRH